MERVFDLEVVLAQVRAALEAGRVDEAVRILSDQRPADLVEVFEELEDEEQVDLLPRLEAEDSADVLEYMDDPDAAELADELADADLVRIIDQMEPDEAADLLGDMEPERRRTILAQLEDPEEVRPLLIYEDDTAGGLMTSEVLALRRRMTVGDALTAVRTSAPSSSADILYYLYVVDRDGRLVGVTSLYDLLRANPTAIVSEVMSSDVITVHVDDDQEEVARLMSRYSLLSAPVVNESGILLGIITYDDLVDVLEREATEDIQRLGATQPLDRNYLDTPVLTVARKRIGWLLLLFLTETLTGSVLRHYETELATVVSLSFFIPLLIGTGGNAGSQSTSTIIRSLALDEIDLSDALPVLWHELRVGLLLGLTMALVGFGRALMWHTPFSVAQAVALALLSIVVWANVVGSVLPLLASKLRIDPAIVSGPFMSTLVDATGLMVYLQIAKLILKI
ncbi:MAG: magnesium transporter [Anaerolineae bacterium]